MDYQKILNKWNIKCDINTILAMWNESHRYYHNLDHLNDLILQIDTDKSKYTQKEYEMLLISALFHDCIYSPTSSENEEKSAKFLIDCSEINNDILEIKQIILDTKTHIPSSKLSESFIKYDMNIVERDFDSLLEWENGIREEYKMYGDKYKEGRLSFLNSLLDKYPNNIKNLSRLINWVEDNY